MPPAALHQPAASNPHTLSSYVNNTPFEHTLTEHATQVAQRWRFASTPSALRKQGTPSVLPNARVRDVGAALAAKSYQVFLQDGELYAFKGLAGRLGPIGVHVALLMCLFGTAYSGFGGWKGSAICPEGGEFLVANALYPASSISTLPKGAKAVLQVWVASVWACVGLCTLLGLYVRVAGDLKD